MKFFTFEPNWMFYIILYFVVLIIYYLATLKKRKKWLDTNVIVNTFFIFYILNVLRLVFTPIDIWFDTAFRDSLIRDFLQQETFTWWDIANINLIPFRSIIETFGGLEYGLYLFTLRAIGGNFIMLMPLPIFLGLIMKEELTFKKTVTIGFLTSLFIEITQLVINLATGWPNRLVCIDDLLLNTLGIMVGYFIFKKWHTFFENIVTKMYKFLISS